jgi:hypothetical protein
MPKLQEHKGRWFITLPKEYIKEKGWIKGQELLISFDAQGRIVVKEVENRLSSTN